MVDIFSRKKRSEIMSRVKSKNTGIELAVAKFLRKEKIRFKRSCKVMGRPDFVLEGKNALFIDGDFWHGWKFKETKRRLPSKYWKDKIACNMKRDRRNRAALKNMGWSVMRIWEHEVEKNEEKAVEKVTKFLHS